MKTVFIMVGLIAGLIGVITGVGIAFDMLLLPKTFPFVMGFSSLTFVGIGEILIKLDIVIKKLNGLKKK